MNTGIVNIILVLTALLAMSGCGTTSVQTESHTTDRPILSAAEVEAMIRVEFRALEPESPGQTVVASAD